MKRLCRASAITLALALCACKTGAGDADRGATGRTFDESEIERVGSARYVTSPLEGEKPPSDFFGNAVQPKLAPGAEVPPVSNDWWSSLLWRFDREGKKNPYSEPMFAHPLALRARSHGLGVSYPDAPVVTPRTYFHPYDEDLRIGVEGLESPDARVADHSDWTVTAQWSNADGSRTLRATFGHGLPFVYADVKGGDAQVEVPSKKSVTVWKEAGEVLGLTVGSHHFGIFAPKGAKWRREGNRFLSDLAGAGFYSVAALPDDSQMTLARFRKHAYAFVTDTKVSWVYDEAQAAVTTTFAFAATLRQPASGPSPSDEPLFALYRHQWKAKTNAALTGHVYASARGLMKAASGRTFQVTLPVPGLLPVMPAPAGHGYDPETLRKELRAAAKGELFPIGPEGTRGTYWTGKSLQRAAQLAWLADQVNEREVRDLLVKSIERRMEEWFDGRTPDLFFYDRTWRTLIGLPQEYRAGWELNDHHFHYAYFINAATTIARFDPSWAGQQRYGAFIDLLLRDAANPDRTDARFPFLRHFDAYAGHSWANGPSLFAEGNNEESSSEDANFATAVLLWGLATERPVYRDLGAFLLAHVVAAIEQYWFDVDGEVFPKEFAQGHQRAAVGMVWGSGAKYDTWWDRSPVYVHGINWLPFSAQMLYLGRHPEYARRNHDAMLAANGGEPAVWRDIVWMHRALFSPGKALEAFASDPYLEPEMGNSRAFTYHWLHALADLGEVDAGVSGDVPTHAVFKSARGRTYVAWNPDRSPRTVKFSDGVELVARPRELTLLRGR